MYAAILCFFAFFNISCENPFIEKAFYLTTITFNTNGGSNVPQQKLLMGEVVSRPADPVKGSSVFLGWYTDNETFDHEWDFKAVPERNMILYAKWESEAAVHYTLILDTSELENLGDSVSFSASDVTLETSASGGDIVTVYYNLEYTEQHNWFSLSINGERVFETYETGTGSYNYIVNYNDANNGVITIHANSLHSDLNLLLSPDNVHFDKTGKITFDAHVTNPTGTTFSFTLFRDNIEVDDFTNMSITSGTVPAGIVNEMLRYPGEYHVIVWAKTDRQDYMPSSDFNSSPSVHVYNVSVTISNAETGETVSVSGHNGSYSTSFNFNAFSSDSVTLTVVHSAERMVTWSGISGTEKTRVIHINGAVYITINFMDAAASVTHNAATNSYSSLAGALDTIIDAGIYTVTLYESQSLAPYTFIANAARDITFVSQGGERIVQLLSSGTFFTVKNGVTLRLDSGITLAGRSAAKNGANNNASLVVVENGGKLFMEDGSKITGNSASSSTGGVGVRIEENGGFTMNGGEISGNTDLTSYGAGYGGAGVASYGTFTMTGGIIKNNTTSSTAGGGAAAIDGTFTITGGEISGNLTGSASSGAVIVRKDAIFSMSGGKIANNTNSNASYTSDLSISSDLPADGFVLSGAAEIGILRLDADENAAANAGVSIGANFIGSVSRVDLYPGISMNMANLLSNWNGKTILKGFNGHTLTADDIAKFPLGNFKATNPVDSQPISNTHYLGISGIELGKLILDPALAPVTVTVNDVITGYLDINAVFTAIGTQTGDFAVMLRENQTMTVAYTINTEGQHITITGAAGARTITHGIATGNMFTINHADASLTLGNNITIQGRTAAASGYVINNSNGTFRMQAGSIITGHTGGSGAVQIYGANARFEMSGGTINGNHTTNVATNSRASGGVLLYDGTFTMTGGSITGNTQGSAAQFTNGMAQANDVLHRAGIADRFTISNSANISFLRLEISSNVTIGAGWTGSIGKLDLYLGSADSWDNQVLFNGISAGQVTNNIGLGDFINTTFERQAISPDFFISTTDEALGRLNMNPATAYVTVTRSGVTSGYALLNTAFTAIGTQTGNFTITLRRDRSLTSGINIWADQNVTIVGEGTERTISHALNNWADLFRINADASLTLGSNITVRGRSTPPTFDINEYLFLVFGTFRMQTGSKITGQNALNSVSPVVYVWNGVFEMSGGSIEGNNNTAGAANTGASSGVYIGSGTFTMTGGSITGNTHSGEASDVYIGTTAANRFTISGNANIGALKLNATSATASASITIGAAGWSGNITTLNLRGDAADITSVVSFWTGRTIFNNMNAAAVNRVGRGEFISSDNTRQAITPRTISASGVLQ